MTQELVGEYVAWRVARGELSGRSPATISAILNQWHRVAGPIEHWSAETATVWVHDPSVGPWARRARRSRLRPYMRWLIRNGHIAEDITEEIPIVWTPAPRPRNLEADAAARLLAVCPDDRARLIVTLMLQCALRCVDLSRARLEDISVRDQLLAVRAKGGRGSITHDIPIPDEAWSLLVPVLAARRCGPIIVNARYRTPTAISADRLSKLVSGWCADAGLKEFPRDGVSAHALRHTTAQDMLDRGASLREVQFALGHNTSRSTELYLRREPPGLRDAMEGRRYAA